MLERPGLHRRELRAWAMYDWANSAFQTTIIADISRDRAQSATDNAYRSVSASAPIAVP